MTAPASARGRANRRKGADTERQLAAYLREVGFAGAERAVRTSYTTASHVLVDPLDITGIPGTVWSVKNDASMQITKWMEEAERIGHHHGAELAILVVRRPRKPEPSRWWAWVSLPALVRAVTGAPQRALSGHVCLELGDLVVMLRLAGYGDEITNEPVLEVDSL